MRAVLDTNILLSMLLIKGTPPDRLYGYWKAGRFDLVTCERQLEEIRRVTRRPFFRERIKPSEAGRLVNDIGKLALLADPLPQIDRSPDPDDNWLLAVAEKTRADFLVTGDKSDLLRLEKHAMTRIVTARFLVDRIAGC
ncbi:MAG: putative toxin-antitoxin system toxin component, PIN family [Methylohalobius crimeensis]